MLCGSLLHIEVSSKTGENVHELFLLLGQQLLELSRDRQEMASADKDPSVDINSSLEKEKSKCSC